MELQTELLNKGYYPYEISSLLTEGMIMGGRNMKRIGLAGGWRPRPGYVLLNTQGEGTSLRSIFQYTNPIWGDYHLLVQTGAEIRDNTVQVDLLTTLDGNILQTRQGEELLARASGDPLEQALLLGAAIFSGVSPKPGFWAVVGEDLIFADGSGRPMIFGGSSPAVRGFLIEDSSGNITDATKVVTDNKDSTYGIVIDSSSYYFCSKEPANGLTLVFDDSRNTQAAVITVSAWRNGSWTSVSASDGTADTGATHARDGNISWTLGADEMRILGNIMGYWYKVEFTGTIDTLHIVTCRASRPASRITNKWSGVFRYTTGALLFTNSTGSYADRLGAVSNESEDQYMDISAMGTSDYIYIKTVEGAAGIGFAMVAESVNTNSAVIDAVEVWDGTQWQSVTFVDETTNAGDTVSFAQTGTVWLDQDELISVRRKISSDNISGHWIRFSVDAALSADVKIAAIVYAARPEPLPIIDGVIEYNGRAVYWGREGYANRLLISPYQKPDQLDDLESRYSFPFGGESPIRACAVLGQNLLVLKEKGVFLMFPDFSIQQLTSTVGIASPKSLVIVEIGERSLKAEEIISVAVWEDVDGFYKISADGNILKISDAIRDLYDPTRSDYIGEGNLGQTYAYASPIDGTYRALVAGQELVYDVRQSEWYPPWERALTLTCAATVKTITDSYRLLGGTSEGFLLDLVSGTSDRNSNNEAVPIIHSVRTRVIPVMASGRFFIAGYLNGLWLELKAGSGEVDVLIYLNQSETALGQLPYTLPFVFTRPKTAELEETGYRSIVRHIELKEKNVYGFEVELVAYTLDQVMEVYSIGYVTKAISLQGR